MASETEKSWLADGVREIERVVRAAQIVEPKIITLPQEKPGTYAIVTPTPAEAERKLDIKVAGPTWHNELLETPQQLQAFIGSLEAARGAPIKEGVCYVNQVEARFHYAFEDRRHRATAPLKMSEPWKWLSTAHNPIDQKSFIRLLRITFAACLPEQSTLVSRLRDLRVNSTGEIQAQMKKGDEAMSKAIAAKLDRVEDLPDEINLTVPVFENFPLPVQVSCALEYDISNGAPRFEMIPYPNQLQIGMEQTLSAIVTLLEETGVPTFVGTSAAGA